jgi:hypothetical protein
MHSTAYHLILLKNRIYSTESIHYAHHHKKTGWVIIPFKVTLWIVSLTIYHKKEVVRQANVVCNNRVGYHGSFRDSLHDSMARRVSLTPMGESLWTRYAPWWAQKHQGEPLRTQCNIFGASRIRRVYNPRQLSFRNSKCWNWGTCSFDNLSLLADCRIWDEPLLIALPRPLFC